MIRASLTVTTDAAFDLKLIVGDRTEIFHVLPGSRQFQVE